MSIYSNFSDLEVVKNIDFVLRSKAAKIYLLACEYPKEPLLETAEYLVQNLADVYKHKILILDFDPTRSSGTTQYQNIQSLDFLSTEDPNGLNIYTTECLNHYDYIFVLPHIKMNLDRTEIPNLKLDSSFLMRTKKSVSPVASRIMTKSLTDSQVDIAGLFYREA